MVVALDKKTSKIPVYGEKERRLRREKRKILDERQRLARRGRKLLEVDK